MALPCVCVTGGTQGIGLAIAEAFARKGARLVVNSHVPDEAALAHLSALGECHFVQADLSTVEGARTLIDRAHDKLGRIDTLVNNAGTFRDVAFEALDAEQFTQTFDLNVRGYLFAAQAFAAKLTGEQTNPSIVCVGSTNSRAAEKNSVIYDSSKGAVLMMVRSLAVTLAARGIRVNGIGPGLVETPLTASGLSAPAVRAAIERQIPLGRIGQPVDIGATAVFLASAEAGYITGQMLYVDGGILAHQLSWDVSP